MTSFTHTTELMYHNFNNPATSQRAILLLGPPGAGKSVSRYVLADMLGVAHANVHLTHPPRQNPVDYMGLPDLNEGVMTWAEPKLLHKLSTGRHILYVEEIAQCGPMMQNTIAGLVLDRQINEVRLSDEVFIVLTGNRVEDRAGAKPIMTHLGNRVKVINMDYTVKDFQPYAMSHPHMDPIGLAYLIRAPQHLFDFDPSRIVNATPRSWEYALCTDYETMPAHLIYDDLCGVLPEHIVSSYLAFRKVAEKLPDPAEVRRNPLTTPVPDEVDVQYVASAALIIETDSTEAFEEIMPYIERMPKEFQTLYVHTVIRRVDETKFTSVYMQWMTKNSAGFGAAA